MSDDWYYRVGEEVFGPVAFEELRHAVAEGIVAADTLVRRTLTGDWLPASDIAGLFDAPAAPPRESSRLVACHDCRRLVSSRAIACPKCGCPGPQVDVSIRPALDGPKRHLLLKLCGVAFAVVGGVLLFFGCFFVLILFLSSPSSPPRVQMADIVANLGGGVALLALSQFCFLAIRVENNIDRLAWLLWQPFRRGKVQQQTEVDH